MIIRKATANDIDAVAKIYDEIHTEIEKGNYATGWVRDIYPLKSTAQNAFEKDWLFVAEDDGKIVATAIINQENKKTSQEKDYRNLLINHCKNNGLDLNAISKEYNLSRGASNDDFRKVYEKVCKM